jgi:predicted ATPase
MASIQRSNHTKTSKTHHNLPDQLTPFVGRTDELAEISRRLANPTCRLLTLVGPGGIGKTRLAVQAATMMFANFADGVYLVSLQPIEDTDLLISAIADALNLSLSGHQEAQTQLANYLGQKRLLLILDNFEHLLPAVTILTDLLQATTGLKMLVTSREALNLPEEWLYQVDGLPYPTITGWRPWSASARSSFC